MQLEETGVIDDAFKKRLNTQIHKINWIDTNLLKKKKEKNLRRQIEFPIMDRRD